MQLGWCDFTTISFSVFPIAEPPIVTFKVKWRWYDSWFPVSLGFLGAKEKQLVWATSSLAHVIALVNVTTTNWSLVGLYRGWRLDSPGLPVLELPATNQKNELEQRWCFWGSWKIICCPAFLYIQKTLVQMCVFFLRYVFNSWFWGTHMGHVRFYCTCIHGVGLYI